MFHAVQAGVEWQQGVELGFTRCLKGRTYWDQTFMEIDAVRWWQEKLFPPSCGHLRKSAYYLRVRHYGEEVSDNVMTHDDFSCLWHTSTSVQGSEHHVLAFVLSRYIANQFNDAPVGWIYQNGWFAVCRSEIMSGFSYIVAGADAEDTYSIPTICNYGGSFPWWGSEISAFESFRRQCTAAPR